MVKKAAMFFSSSSVSRGNFFPLIIPEIFSAPAEHLPLLKVTPPRASVHIPRNSRATFDCEVINGHGKAEPIVWSPLLKGAFQEKNTLVIDPVQPEHNGTFTCRSGNMMRLAVLSVGEWQVFHISRVNFASSVFVHAACARVCVCVCLFVNQ